MYFGTYDAFNVSVAAPRHWIPLIFLPTRSSTLTPRRLLLLTLTCKTLPVLFPERALLAPKRTLLALEGILS